MPTDLQISRVDDRTIVRFFEAAAFAGDTALHQAMDEGLELLGSGHEVVLTYSTGLPWELSEDDIMSAPPGRYVISNATVSFRFQTPDGRNPRTETISFSLTRAEGTPNADRFQIRQNGNSSSMSQEGCQKVLRAIHTELSPLLRPAVPEDGGLIPTLTNLSEAFSTTYQGIATELSASVAAVSAERTKQLTEFQEERKGLRAEIAEERRVMQEEAQKEALEAKMHMDLERAKLDAEWEQLEVSSHKDARRKQFLKLQEELQKALQEPVADAGLRRTRNAVFGALLCAAFAAAFFAYLTITNSVGAGENTASWLLPTVKTSVLTFTSLASFFGAAAWLRFFYVRDVGALEEMRRFRNDMARASWVMDAALEIRKEHDETIPPEWIAGVTEGLFAAQKRDTLEEGAHALAALVGLSASTTVGPNGTTVEIGKKGAKAVKNAVKGDG